VYLEVSDRVQQPSYADLNASLGWHQADSGFGIKLWGKNLTNKAVLNALVNTNANDAVTYSPPRSFGIDATYKF
jgi:iron complex outermembrane receptor protein